MLEHLSRMLLILRVINQNSGYKHLNWTALEFKILRVTDDVFLPLSVTCVCHLHYGSPSQDTLVDSSPPPGSFFSVAVKSSLGYSSSLSLLWRAVQDFCYLRLLVQKIVQNDISTSIHHSFAANMWLWQFCGQHVIVTVDSCPPSIKVVKDSSLRRKTYFR